MKKIKKNLPKVLFVLQLLVIGSLLFLTLASCKFKLFVNNELIGRKYYVRTTFENEGTQKGKFSKLKKAKKCADLNAVYGYRVYSGSGKIVYTTYGELAADILREAKYITDYVREYEFKYGDAPINPAIDHTAKKVSCDRLVDWVMYRVGFTNQPHKSGMVVWFKEGGEKDLQSWCQLNNYKKIENQSDLLPGDIVFVNLRTNDRPDHTFIHGGVASDSTFYRYDCGSDKRIQSQQPFSEPIIKFFAAYRPVRKRSLEEMK